MAAGLRDTISIVGKDELGAWKLRLGYRDASANLEVAFRSARLLSPVTLFQLTHERGDSVRTTQAGEVLAWVFPYQSVVAVTGVCGA